MKKLMFFILTFMLAAASACLANEKGNTAAEECVEEAKPLDLGEPTPEERSQMEREAKEKRLEESGFDESLTDDASTEEIAGDDSEARWEFN